MSNIGDTSGLVTRVTYTHLSKQWKAIITAMVASSPGLQFEVERGVKVVSVKIKKILFHPEGYATVVFSKIGKLNTEYEQPIIKERIRQLLDIRHY